MSEYSFFTLIECIFNRFTVQEEQKNWSNRLFDRSFSSFSKLLSTCWILNSRFIRSNEQMTGINIRTANGAKHNADIDPRYARVQNRTAVVIDLSKESGNALPIDLIAQLHRISVKQINAWKRSTMVTIMHWSLLPITFPSFCYDLCKKIVTWRKWPRNFQRVRVSWGRGKQELTAWKYGEKWMSILLPIQSNTMRK